MCSVTGSAQGDNTPLIQATHVLKNTVCCTRTTKYWLSWCCQVYKSVLMTNGEYDSIIAFYNRIFMQSLKTFIMQFANSRVL